MLIRFAFNSLLSYLKTKKYEN
jgi:Nucleolar protein,Nop52